MADNSWPARTALCLSCRTAFASGRACPVNPRHQVARLDRKDDRERLLTAIWGPPSARARAKQAAKAGGGGAAGGAVADGCGSASCDAGALDPEALLVIAVVAIAFVILYFVGSALLGLWRRYRSRLIPNGAVTAGLSAGHGRGRVGTVVARATAQAPLTYLSCVAFANVLSYKRWFRARKVTLRDAATIGFDIELDSGERARIPAGLIALDTRAASPVNPTPQDVEEYLAGIDETRTRDASDDCDTAPFTEIRQVLIETGARVVVRGQLEPRPDVEAAPGDYREQAPTVLVPVGVPRLALERRSV